MNFFLYARSQSLWRSQISELKIKCTVHMSRGFSELDVLLQMSYTRNSKKETENIPLGAVVYLFSKKGKPLFINIYFGH